MTLWHIRKAPLVAVAGLASLVASCVGAEAPSSAQGPAPSPVPVQVEVTVQAPSEQPTEEVQPTEEAQPEEAADPAAALKAALEAKDYAALEALMAPSIGFGMIASERVTYTPAEFIEQLQTNYLGPGSVQVDLRRDVRSEASTDYQGVLDSYYRTLYSTGWGQTQMDTALLFLDEQGQWVGMMYMLEGMEWMLFASEGGAAGGTDYKDLGSFQTALLEGITEKRDYALLQSLMGDPFTIGHWQSESQTLTPAAAAGQLQAGLLPPTAYIYYTLGGDLTALLGGVDPLAMWGPDVKAVRAIHSTGWGPDGNGEAILIIAQRPDGTYYWHAILYAPGGF